MSLFSDRERDWIEDLSRLTYCNPFVTDRIEYEKRLLGEQFTPSMDVWNYRVQTVAESPNTAPLRRRCVDRVETARRALLDGVRVAPAESGLFRDAVYYMLFDKHRNDFTQLAPGDTAGGQRLFNTLERELRHYLGPLLGDAAVPDRDEIAHLYACMYQIRRAFVNIFQNIVGASAPIAALRSAIWQSIFTHDLRRYQRVLYARLPDMATLITGPSGTGKELVARAIGHSSYIPYRPAHGGFASPSSAGFHPLNLSALSANLLESQLFGHVKGAFTGAISDHTGFLEICGPHGAVFLDEIGEVDLAVQVKLLRTLETRQFHRLGETAHRRFDGKLIAATNRDLALEQEAGRFRRDFYFRLCGDLIVTPSLRDQIDAQPEALVDLVYSLSHQLVGAAEADALSDEVCAWIRSHLPADYPWHGNVRELGQCIRNILIRRDYRPSHALAPAAADPARAAIDAMDWSADQLLNWYCRRLYAATGSYSEAARRLGLDRRTVKARCESAD